MAWLFGLPGMWWLLWGLVVEEVETVAEGLEELPLGHWKGVSCFGLFFLVTWFWCAVRSRLRKWPGRLMSVNVI